MNEEKRRPAPEEGQTPETAPKPQAPGDSAKEEPGKAAGEPVSPQQVEEVVRLADDLAALTDKHLRLAAEYDNFRKRSQRERESIYPDATAAAVLGFLAVADNLERALAAPCGDPEYKKGTEMTYQSLLDAFSRLKVEPFGAPGDRFDPALHNAVMHDEDDSAPESSVAEVFLKGYRMGDRILRCAMVKVVN